MEKSYVALEQKLCIVCGTTYDTNSLLIHKNLSNTLDRHECTGYGMCDYHAKLRDEGYIALVIVDPSKSTFTDGVLKPESAWRTGELAHIRRQAWSGVFNTDAPEGDMVFAERGVLAQLQQAALAI